MGMGMYGCVQVTLPVRGAASSDAGWFRAYDKYAWHWWSCIAILCVDRSFFSFLFCISFYFPPLYCVFIVITSLSCFGFLFIYLFCFSAPPLLLPRHHPQLPSLLLCSTVVVVVVCMRVCVCV